MNNSHSYHLALKVAESSGPGRLLYVGANRLRCHLADPLRAMGNRLTLLEAWPENAAHYRGQGRFEEVVEGDVRRLDELGLAPFDTTVWWHGPEHILREELATTLAAVERQTRRLVLLGCPYGNYPQGAAYGNPHEEHKAVLYPADFAALGYQMAAVGQADHPDGEIVAWKWLTAGPNVPHLVMVTHGDRANFLRQTIPAVLSTTWPLTLTVVANAPSPASRTYLREIEPQLHRLIINKKNLGKSTAANQGRKLRDAAYTVILDDDALALEPDWLRKLTDIADCCPEVGIVGHSLEPGRASWPLQVLGSPRRTVQVQPANLGSACMLIPRRTVELCGYFNEELPLYGEEDYLYGWKVRRAGLLCAYFDHTDLGRSFKHLGENDAPEYRAWKDDMRRQAIPVRDKLIEEYLAGRPLNT
jgi:hypothetical protein